MLEQDAQRKRTQSGAFFQARVQALLTEQLHPVGVVAAPCTQEALETALGGIVLARATLSQVTRAPAQGCSGRPNTLVPRSALLAVRRADLRVLAVIDCSVSIHSRQTEVCFWAQLLRPGVPFVFVTEDRDVYTGRQRSELGPSCERASTARKMLESFTDGVFLLAPGDPVHEPPLILMSAPQQPLFDHEGIEGHTAYCERVRPFDDLIRRVAQWAGGESG